VNNDFFNGASAQYPVPFANVMIGTFMLEALRGASNVHDALARLKLNWPHAMVLVSSRAGTNVSSGLTEGTNWLALFLKAVSGFTLPDDRIKIVPYAEVRPSLGQAQLEPNGPKLLCAARMGTAVLSQSRFRSGFRGHSDDLPACPTVRRCRAITS
jgi:hypothetical protein